MKVAPPELVLSEIAIKDLPLYRSDYDADCPPVARAFKQAIAEVVQFKPGLITADGEVTDEGTKQFLQNDMTDLHAFIVGVLTVLPRSA